MSFNNYLLSKLTHNLSKGADAYSLSKRYQALWIIYCNFMNLIGLFTWKMLNQTYTPSTGDNSTGENSILISYPLTILSFLLLKKGKNSVSAFFALFAIHIGNYAAGRDAAIASAHFLVVMPGFGFLLSSSTWVHLLNVLGCVFLNIFHMYNVEKRFQVTFTEEQRYEIVQLHMTTFISLTSITGLFFVLNSSKNTLWQLAQTNFVRTEEIAKEMVQVAKAKDTFVSALSHEIRNPLNCMTGSIDYLLQIIKDPAHLQLLSNAKMSGEVLLNLLSNVLDAAKMKAEKMELFYVEANIAETIKKVMVLFCEKIREKKMKTTVYIDRSLPSVMWIDPSRLLQILINLLSNAFKFSKDRGKIKVYMSWCSSEQEKEELLSPIMKMSAQKENLSSRPAAINLSPQTLSDVASMEELSLLDKNIKVKNFQLFSEGMEGSSSKTVSFKDGNVSKIFISYNIANYIDTNTLQILFSDLPSIPKTKIAKTGYLKIQVSDKGSGIDQDSIPDLFKMFTQGSNVTTYNHSGSGLGLWICKQLCTKMGGDITLYSKVNVGTTFVLYIPINNDRLSMAPAPSIRRTRECIRALVVDDFAYNRDMHKLILERENIQVVVASDGKKALDTFTTHEEDYFQFIMMDVNMPVMDGFTSARKIREWEATEKRKKVDIYFVSGEYYNEEEVMRALKNAGGIGGIAEMEGIKCLKKPISVDQIRKLLEKFRNGHSKE